MPWESNTMKALRFVPFVVGAGLLGSLGTAAAQQPASTRFDGVWSVDVSCENAADGAFGYTWQFSVQVADGLLHGEHGQRGQRAWMTLDGPIQPDGSAVLLADGLTGLAAYNVGRVGEKQRFRYHVKAQFGSVSGIGTRVETRPCTLAFTKQ